MIGVRDATAADEEGWRRLWAGYLDFYRTTLAPEMTALTWRRMLDPAFPILGRLAEVDGAVVGFALAVLHPGTWVEGYVCYLEDLFVAPEARGAGVGRALIDDLIRLGAARGWSRLSWHTASNNPARILYDRFVPAGDVVHYQLSLPPTPDGG